MGVCVDERKLERTADGASTQAQGQDKAQVAISKPSSVHSNKGGARCRGPTARDHIAPATWVARHSSIRLQGL